MSFWLHIFAWNELRWGQSSAVSTAELYIYISCIYTHISSDFCLHTRSMAPVLRGQTSALSSCLWIHGSHSLLTMHPMNLRFYDTMSFCVHVFQWWFFSHIDRFSIAKLSKVTSEGMEFWSSKPLSPMPKGASVDITTLFSRNLGKTGVDQMLFCRWGRLVVDLRLLLQMSCICVDAHIYIYICVCVFLTVYINISLSSEYKYIRCIIIYIY